MPTPWEDERAHAYLARGTQQAAYHDRPGLGARLRHGRDMVQMTGLTAALINGAATGRTLAERFPEPEAAATALRAVLDSRDLEDPATITFLAGWLAAAHPANVRRFIAADPAFAARLPFPVPIQQVAALAAAHARGEPATFDGLVPHGYGMPGATAGSIEAWPRFRVHYLTGPDGDPEADAALAAAVAGAREVPVRVSRFQVPADVAGAKRAIVAVELVTGCFGDRESDGQRRARTNRTIVFDNRGPYAEARRDALAGALRRREAIGDLVVVTGDPTGPAIDPDGGGAENVTSWFGPLESLDLPALNEKAADEREARETRPRGGGAQPFRSVAYGRHPRAGRRRLGM